MSCQYSVIIPAYNEEQAIAQAIHETVEVFVALAVPFEIIVVDDGSEDRTATVIQKLQRTIPQLLLIRHPKNCGKGAAVRTGVEKSQGNFFLFLDADLATHPSEFIKFIPMFKRADMIIGSRTISGTTITKSQPWYRILAGKIFNMLFVRWYLGLPYHDTQCGFKAFSKKTKPLFHDMQTSGWVFDVELLLHARQVGFRILELPVVWRHGRESKVRLRDAWKILKEIWRIKRTEDEGLSFKSS